MVSELISYACKTVKLVKNSASKYLEFGEKHEEIREMYESYQQNSIKTNEIEKELDLADGTSNRELLKMGDFVSRGNKIAKGNKFFGAYKRILFVGDAKKRVRSMETHCNIVEDSRFKRNTMMMLSDTKMKLSTIIKKMDRDGIHFSDKKITSEESLDECKVFSGVIIGNRDPYRELVEMVFEDDLCAINISGPPSCVKTSFANRLVEDTKIKEVFGDKIYYMSVQGTLNKDTFFTKLCEKLNCPVWGTDIIALRAWIENNSPIMLIVDDVSPNWEAFLGELNFPITSFKLLILSEWKLLSFRGYDLINVFDENGQMLYVLSTILKKDRSNSDDINDKPMKDGKAPPTSFESAADVFMWGRRNYNSSKGKAKVECLSEDGGSTSGTAF